MIRYVTPQGRECWLRLREVALRGGDIAEAMAATGLRRKGLESMLWRACQSIAWPPAPFPDFVFDYPVRASGHHSGEQMRIAQPKRCDLAPCEIKLDDAALAARVAADQARLHGPRLAWLEAERERYGLPRRARLPEEMAA